jgi:biotin carboxyl carrier protein
VALRGAIEAPMSGTVVKVNVSAGETVKALAVLLAIEAMKMEHVIAAPYAAVVSAVKVRAGQSVAAGDVLVELEET